MAALNWIFFRESDDFDSAFQSLIEAIDTDLDWVRAHTRLLVRAIEWDNEERDASFVLRGRDLEEAEQWLAQGADKELKPTPLHAEYITARQGRKSRKMRLRLALHNKRLRKLRPKPEPLNICTMIWIAGRRSRSAYPLD